MAENILLEPDLGDTSGGKLLKPEQAKQMMGSIRCFVFFVLQRLKRMEVVKSNHSSLAPMDIRFCKGRMKTAKRFLEFQESVY